MTGNHKPLRWMSLCLAMLFLGAGCAHDLRPFPTIEPPPPLPRKEPYALDRTEEVETRIKRVRAVLETTPLSPEDRFLAQELLQAYRAVEAVPPRPLDQELQGLIQLLLSSLMRLDERYFKSLSEERAEWAEAMSFYSRKKEAILDGYLAGDYQGVIERAVELENLFGPDSFSPQIGLVLAVSLARQGMIQEALRVGIGISDDLERAPGAIELRAKMVEWQMALGDRKGAVHNYEKIVENLQERETLLKGAERHLTGVVGQDDFSGKKEAPTLPLDFAKISPSLQQDLDQVKALVERGDFDGAKLLLLRLSLRLEGEEEAELVEEAMRSVEAAEKTVLAREVTDPFQRRQALELAADLIEQERYEEAIAQIDTVLLWGGEFGAEAKQLQDLAVEKIVKRQRNEAARLFLMARNTRDPARKEEYLAASYDILKALVEKYPQNPLRQTIHDNMRRIEEERSKLRKGTG